MSIRTRLFFLVILSTTSLMIASGFQLLLLREQQINRSTEYVKNTAQQIANQLDSNIQTGIRLLEHLAKIRALNTNNATCTEILTSALQQFPQYSNIAAFKPNGSLYCTGLQKTSSSSIVDQRILLDKFTSEKPVIGPITQEQQSEKHVLPITYPVKHPNQALKLILVATLDLESAAENFTSTFPASLLVIAPPTGKPLVRFPHEQEDVSEAELAQLTTLNQQNGQASAQALKDSPHIWGIATLPTTTSLDLKIFAGIDKTTLFDPADNAITTSLLIFAFVSSIGLGAAWIVDARYIRQPLHRLLATYKQLAEGSAPESLDIPDSFAEFRELTHNFKQWGERSKRTNSTLTMLNACNQTLLNAENETILLQDICRIAVRIGGYRAAWIGFQQHDVEKNIQVQAAMNIDVETVRSMKITWADTEQDQDAIAVAMRNKQPVIVRALANDPVHAHWAHAAAQYGLASCIALPLFYERECLGTFNLYAANVDAFDDDEVARLTELADNLSSGIAALRFRQQHQQLVEGMEHRHTDLENKISECIAQLEASKLAVQDLYHQTPCGYHSLNESGVFISINNTALDWLGYSRSELIDHMKFTDLMTPASKELFAQHFSSFKRTGQIKDMELELIRKGGGILPVSISANIVHTPDGAFLMTRASMLDISKRRRAQEELASAAAYESTHGRALTLFNSTYDRDTLFNALLALLAERHPFPASAIYCYDEWQGVFRCAASWAVAGALPKEFAFGEGLVGEAARANCCMVIDQPSGISIDTGLLAFTPTAIMVSPIFHQQRHLGVLVLAASRSVTPRDRSFVERLCIQLGVALHNIKQYEDTRLMAEELRTRGEEVARKNAQLEETNRLKSEFLANMSHELRTPLNAIIGFSETLRDGLVGELQPLQQEFISDIYDSGHHLLALINDILDLSKVEAGKMSLELETMDITDMLRSCLSIIKERALNHNIALKVDTDSDAPLITADVRKLKQIVYNLLSNAVKFTPDGGTITVKTHKVDGSVVALKQIIAALPTTHKYTPVEAPSWQGDWLEISVNDTGIGIPPESLPKLFQPFEQVDSSLSRQYGGTGLGLAMVRRLVLLHGGTLGVASEQGQGTTFVIWLPYRTDTQFSEDKTETNTYVVNNASSETSPTESKSLLCEKTTHASAPLIPFSEAKHERPPHVLLVEDDNRAAEWMRQQLEAESFLVSRASSGETALELASQSTPDLIVLDILLPGIDGWQFLSTIKNDPNLNEVPVVILSVAADPRKGFALGAAKVLQKPLRRAELLAVLHEMGFDSHANQNIKVLVVDDDPKAVEIIAAYLESDHFSVVRAYGGKEAIECAERLHPDLLVIDLIMPGITGFDVVQALKNCPETSAIPIIVITAKLITADDRKRLNGNVHEILQKSDFDRPQFLTEIKRALRTDSSSTIEPTQNSKKNDLQLNP